MWSERFWHRKPSKVYDKRWLRDHPACEAVVAFFVFGPQLCLDEAEYTVEIDGERVALCEEHFNHLKEVE